jgi:ornithine cyclodeaminase/alanine dehydrogenase-like protein (mu-crystallin family)
MSTLYLQEADVERLLDMRLAVDVVEEAFRRLASGEAVNVPRVRAISPDLVLHTMSAGAAYLGTSGWKAYATTRYGGRFHVGLYDHQTGQLAALLEAQRLGQVRTGATTGVAAQWMAHLDASEVGVFGSGFQAETQLEALCTVRPIRTAFVYSRSEERRQAFADRMSARLNIEVTPVDRPQEAAEDLPIVVTATTSREPVFDGASLAEGTLVCAVGSNWLNRAEIDANVARLADNIVCDSIEACRHEAGDFIDALEKGVFDWTRAVDLCEVVSGRAVGRSRVESITLFKSVGLAIEDVAIAARLVELARAERIGTELPI